MFKLWLKENVKRKTPVILHATPYKTITGNLLIMRTTVNSYFHLPLCQTINCYNNILWAYNNGHWSELKNHIESKLCKREITEKSNKTIGSRLPRWMSSKANRETVLKAIQILKQKN